MGKGGYNPYGPGNGLGPPPGGAAQQAESDTDVALDQGGVPAAPDTVLSKAGISRGRVTGRARAKVAAFRNSMKAKGGY